MSSVVLNTIQATMSSREIAELVDSRHDSVKRTIERLVAQGVIESPPLVDFKNINNVAGQEYVFSGKQGKRNSIIVVAQLSPEFTARLVDRWQELEAGRGQQLAAIKDPQIAAMVTMLTQLDAVKQEQAAQRSELADIRAKLTATPEEYYTVAGYASLRGISIDTKRANLLGRKASKISKEHGLDIGKAHSAIHGTVNTYHVDVLCEVFG